MTVFCNNIDIDFALWTHNICFMQYVVCKMMWTVSANNVLKRKRGNIFKMELFAFSFFFFFIFYARQTANILTLHINCRSYVPSKGRDLWNTKEEKTEHIWAKHDINHLGLVFLNGTFKMCHNAAKLTQGERKSLAAIRKING